MKKNINYIIYGLLGAIAILGTITAIRCGSGGINFNIPVNIPVDSTITDVDIDKFPEIDSTTVEEDNNDQLIELVKKIDSLTIELQAAQDFADHELGRHLKYKDMALHWEGQYFQLLDSVISIVGGSCDEKLKFVTNALNTASSELTGRTEMLVQTEREAEELNEKYNTLLNELDKQYTTSYTDSLSNGMVLNATIKTDGFPLQAGMYNYNLTGELRTSKMIFGQTNKMRKTQVGILYGRGGGFNNNVYSVLYARNYKGINLYLQPVYYDTDSDFKVQDFSANNFGVMFGLGLNFK